MYLLIVVSGIPTSPGVSSATRGPPQDRAHCFIRDRGGRDLWWPTPCRGDGEGFDSPLPGLSGRPRSEFLVPVLVPCNLSQYSTMQEPDFNIHNQFPGTHFYCTFYIAAGRENGAGRGDGGRQQQQHGAPTPSGPHPAARARGGGPASK